MNRREAVKLTSVLLGSSLVGSTLFLSACTNEDKKKNLFSDKDLILLNEIGETILPATERSPGAREANVAGFMQSFVLNCYRDNEQTIFLNGISDIDFRSNKNYGKDFVQLAPDQQTELLTELDKQARDLQKSGETTYYLLMKQLTVLGYFSSEIGVTKALRYEPVPGRYDGCVPYKKGQPAWYGPISSIG